MRHSARCMTMARDSTLPWVPFVASSISLLLTVGSGKSESLEDHHVFPIGRPSLTLEQRFKAKGINPNDFCVTVPKQSNPRGRVDTRAWTEWLDANPAATREEIYRQGGWFLYEFGLDGEYVVGPGGLVHPYRMR